MLPGTLLQNKLNDLLSQDSWGHRCLYCRLPLGPSSLTLPGFNGSKLHADCVTPFMNYWACMLLGDLLPVSTNQVLCNSQIVSDELLRNSAMEEGVLDLIIHKVAHEVSKKLPFNAKIDESELHHDRNPSSLTSTISIRLHYHVNCMFCGGSLRVSQLSYKPWEQNDLIFPDQGTRFEEVLQSEDKKFAFHKSCLNDTLQMLTTYHGGIHE